MQKSNGLRPPDEVGSNNSVASFTQANPNMKIVHIVGDIAEMMLACHAHASIWCMCGLWATLELKQLRARL